MNGDNAENGFVEKNESSGRKRSQMVLPDERKNAVINYLKEFEQGTTPILVDVVGLSAGRTRALLREMVNDGTVRKIGDNRFTYYILKG